MKPLDLQVGIQNSYEAARSEGVRLEKTHVAGMLANEDAQRDQTVRDHSVTAPESKGLQDDLFSSEEYSPADYADAGSSQGKGGTKKKKPAVVAVPEKPEEKAETEKPANDGHFSTYA